MKNASDIHAHLDEIIDGLKSGSMKIPTASEINNAIGKKINLAKLEIEYAILRKKLGRDHLRIAALEDATPHHPSNP